MRILLINPPNGLYDKTYLAPPLGLLTLASFIQQFGYEIEIFDLNLEMLADASVDSNYFYDYVVNQIIERAPDVVGFTSMCLESHVSLKIAHYLKKDLPDIITIFGGTHFGAISNEILERFDFVDFVVTGEGEYAFLSILNKLSSVDIALPENVTYRHKSNILKGLTENKRLSLEEIPFPAYELIELDRYFELNPSHLFNFEAGRGCVFKCAFCYSPFHYGDSVRHKSPERVVEELKRLVELDAKHIFFVQDNFLNSPRWASELCRQIADANLPLTWECYTTYPQLKEPIIDLLSNAGCIGIFTGIDAVSISSQKRMNKPFLRDWQKTSVKLSDCLEKDILPICAFILEEPDQDIEKIESVIYTALECVKLGCEIHLNTLSLYNGTELYRKSPKLNFTYSTIKPELLLDTPKIVQYNDFAKEFPDLFPYHSTYCNLKDWEIFTAKAHTLLALILGLTKTLYQFVINEGKSVWLILDYINDNFVSWIRNLNPADRHEAVIFEFARHFSIQKLSYETKFLFQSELAKIILSNRKNPRFVTFSINGDKYQAELAWFINYGKFQILDDFEKGKILEFSTKPEVFLDNASVPLNNNYKVALLRRDKKIQVFSIPLDFWELLLILENASGTGEIVKLNQLEKEALLQNKWITLTENKVGAF